MEEVPQVVVINEKDNVATALETLKTGTEVIMEVQGRVEKIRLLSDIPMGHKFALKEIDQGQAVIKYGEPIGQSTTRIAVGEHVHIHNVMSPSRGELR